MVMTVEIGEELLFGEEGKEETYEVVFTCELNGKHYLLAALSEELDDETKEPDIIGFSYKEDEEGTLYYDEIESDEEWQTVEEKFQSYLDEIEKEG